MKLYTQSRNSAGERVRIALHLKGIAYDYVAIPSLPRGDYRRINPQGLMPAVEIDGRVIAQSTAILEFIEETHPNPPLLPADPVGRAEVRGFAQLIASDLHPLNTHRIRRYLGAKLEATEAQILAWYRHWVDLALTALEETFQRRPAESAFCFGDDPGWADLHLVPQLSTARRFGCDLAAYPLLLAVEARCTQLEAFQRAQPEAQPDFEGWIKTVVRPV
jgi:maleylpyruvate isomerase